MTICQPRRCGPTLQPQDQRGIRHALVVPTFPVRCRTRIHDRLSCRDRSLCAQKGLRRDIISMPLAPGETEGWSEPIDPERGEIDIRVAPGDDRSTVLVCHGRTGEAQMSVDQ